MTTPPKSPPDTGERDTLADEADARVLRRERTAGPVARESFVGVHDMQRTPPPSDSSQMYDIAERVVERNRPAEWVACEAGGPARRLAERINGLERDQIERIRALEAGQRAHDERLNEMDNATARVEGSNEAMAKLAGRSAAFRTAIISGAFALVAVFLSFVLNRHFPPQAQAMPSTTQMVGRP